MRTLIGLGLLALGFGLALPQLAQAAGAEGVKYDKEFYSHYCMRASPGINPQSRVKFGDGSTIPLCDAQAAQQAPAQQVQPLAVSAFRRNEPTYDAHAPRR